MSELDLSKLQPDNGRFPVEPVNPEADGLWRGYPEEAWKKDSLAVVSCAGEGVGVVLWTAGPHVRFEMEEIGVGVVLDDLELDDAPTGISVWEGRYHVTSDGDRSVPVGSFRSLTDAEWSKVRNNECPWDDDDWRRTEPTDEAPV